MFVRILLLCFTLLFCYSNAAVAILPYVPKPREYECYEGCYVPDLETVLPYDEPYSPADGSTCRAYICQTNNDTIIETCASIGVGDGCWKVKGNLYLEYPDCCDRVKCKHL